MSRSILVLAAHPDDEALGFAGVIATARRAGEHVRVAVATNGDSPVAGRALRRAGARSGSPAATVRYGARRTRETVAAMRELGLRWHPDPLRSDVLFLGHRNGLLGTGPTEGAPDPTGLGRTYAADPRAGRRVFRNDLAFLLRGEHAPLGPDALDADLAMLLALTEPEVVYTHAPFDGHPDHAALFAALERTLARARASLLVRTTLIHPEGSGERMYDSALEWPNPPQDDNNPLARLRPDLPFEPPPTAGGPDWGPLGPPDELVELAPELCHHDPEQNLKWRAIRCYRSQLHCDPDASGLYHPACGYLRAFAKRHEFFWRHPFVNGADSRPARHSTTSGQAVVTRS